MILSGLRTVVYKVPRLQEAKEWYSRVFGMEPYFDEPFYVGFNVGGYELGLDPDMNGVQPGNGNTTYWGVANVQQTVIDLAETFGIEVVEGPQNVGGPIWVATIADPFGNNIGLIENPDFAVGK